MIHLQFSYYNVLLYLEYNYIGSYYNIYYYPFYKVIIFRTKLIYHDLYILLLLLLYISLVNEYSNLTIFYNKLIFILTNFDY